MKPSTAVIVTMLGTAATSVRAQPPVVTSADVATAPRPGRESGRVDPLDPGDSPVRIIGRALLWIPRFPLELAIQPVRGLLYLQGKRSAGSISHGDVDPTRAVNIDPRFLYQSTFAPHGGVRVALTNIAGRDEEVGLRVGFGGHLGGVVAADATTGQRLGRLEIGVEGRYDRRNDERFFGYGNATDVVPSRYHRRSERVVSWARVALPASLHVELRGALVKQTFGADDGSDDLSLGQAYDPATIPGFLGGVTFVRTEVEASWDTRRAASAFDPHGIRDTGALVLGYVSHDADLDGNRDTFRYGFDLQQDIRLTEGPRTLELRLAGEAISSDLAHVVFDEVPALGGDLLHSAIVDRYRDRVAVVARATYMYALGYQVAGLLFTEAGRVYHSVEDLTLHGLHGGVGFGVEGYTDRALLVHADVTVSSDGDVFFSVGFLPPNDGRSRVRD